MTYPVICAWRKGVIRYGPSMPVFLFYIGALVTTAVLLMWTLVR